MRKSKKLLSFLALLCLIMSVIILPARSVLASETSDTYQHIYDNAELLSTSKLTDMEEMCVSYGNEAGINIFILTHNDSSAVDGEKYIENFYDTSLYGTYNDSVILLIDMHNRQVVLEAYGNAENYIPSSRGDVIIKEITPYLTDTDYATAFELYIKDSAAYMKETAIPNTSGNYTKEDQYGNYVNTSSGSSEPSILTNLWLQLGVAVAVGAITVAIMAYNSGGRMTVGGNTYMDQNHSGLIGRRDDYLRTTVTRVRKPQNNNNSGGGFSGGVSAGGNSHSTSRGSF
ncbi:MAG TPA: TPM domain-containing protein [Mobilitalea sp.]|nr:TPM domain-containing protein [Mobilitalea sp.]